MKPYNIVNIIPVGTVLNTDLNSNPLQVYNSFAYSIQLEITGTPTGTFKLQASCDSAINAISSGNYAGINAPVNWSDIPLMTQAVSAAGLILFNPPSSPGYNWVRIVYTDGSSGMSTAIVTVSTLNSKGF